MKKSKCHPDRPSASGELCARCLNLMTNYGLTSGEYDRMLDEQSGVCAICHNKNGAKELAVDHDHTTGKVRGLLCTNCNIGIGNFKDNPARLLAAARYLAQSDCEIAYCLDQLSEFEDYDPEEERYVAYVRHLIREEKEDI